MAYYRYIVGVYVCVCNALGMTHGKHVCAADK